MMDDRFATLMRRIGLRQTLSVLIFTAVLFAPAGTLCFWQVWVFYIVFLGTCVLLGLYFLKHNPTLIVRRMRSGPMAEQEPVQKIRRPPSQVRRPLLLMIGIPLALGSTWTVSMLVPTIPALAWRLLDDERVLRLDLPGNAHYCRQVRYRLVPGLW